MNVLLRGYRYELEDFEGPYVQPLNFIHKERDLDSDTFSTVSDGTTNEEVLRVLIDRLRFLNEEKIACRQNSIAITKLEEALMWLEHRTAERREREVEGTPLP